MAESVRIPREFNGPLASGQGGYSAGAVAAFVDGLAEVSLRSPVPLDTPLDVVRARDGSVTVMDGETLVAEAHRVAEIDIDVPAPVGPDEARVATTRDRGQAEGIFSRCFVCGRGREDSLEVFAGAVDGRQVLASPWTPPAWTSDASGHVRPELVWAVLDCPATFAAYMDEDSTAGVLARVSVRIDAPVVAGEEHVVIGWPVEADGRRRHAGSAVLARDGSLLAVSRALLITPRAA